MLKQSASPTSITSGSLASVLKSSMQREFSPSVLFMDVETVGLNGPLKLIQWAFGSSQIQTLALPKGWESDETTVLAVRQLLANLYNPAITVVGFNVGFDLYHLYRVTGNLYGHKPFLCQVVDLLNHAKLRGPFAAWAFSKKNGKVRVGKLPKSCVEVVVNAIRDEITPLVPGHAKINVSHHAVDNRPDLETISFNVSCSVGLKAHAKHWGLKVQNLKDIWPLPPKELEKLHLPYYEEGVYDEFERQADAVLRDKSHKFWKYATDDIVYTRTMYEQFGCPAPDHHDATVATVAFTRFFGVPLDRPELERTKADLERRIQDAENLLAGTDLNSPKQRLALLRRFIPILASTNKKKLEALLDYPSTPDAARPVLSAMVNYGRIQQLYRQVLKALESKTGRLHIDLRVVGTSTGRMAGAGGFNIQGVSKDAGETSLRRCLLTSMVGDFSAFEVTIAEAVWADKQLSADLAAGIDIHLLCTVLFHPKCPKGITYETADKRALKPLRDQIKSVVFGIMYGAEAHKVASILGISEGQAEQVLAAFFARYPGIKAFRELAKNNFLTGDTRTWKLDSISRMSDHAEDLTGYRRYWAFEKSVADRIWRLTDRRFKQLPVGTIIRQVSKGPQTLANAVRSGLLGAALAIQKAVFRQAVNMPIQATGANLTKMLMAELWNKFHIPMINVHDEIVFIHCEWLDCEAVQAYIADWVNKHVSMIRFLAFDLKQTERWSDK